MTHSPRRIPVAGLDTFCHKGSALAPPTSFSRKGKLHPSGWFFSQLGKLEMADLVSFGSTETNVPIPFRSLRSGPHSGPSHICHQRTRCRHDTCYGQHQINSLSLMLFQRSDKWNYGTKCNWCQARCRDQLTDEWLQSVILDNKGDNFSDWGVFLVPSYLVKFRGQPLKSTSVGFCL